MHISEYIKTSSLMHEKQGKYVFFSHTGINLQQIQKDNTATTKVKNKSIEMGEVLR